MSDPGKEQHSECGKWKGEVVVKVAMWCCEGDKDNSNNNKKREGETKQ